MAKVYVGLDVGSSTCHMVAVDKDGCVLEDRKIDTSEANLIAVFGAIRGEVQVHLEASELAAWIRRTLKGRVAKIVVSHAKTNAWITKDPLKRDRVDAYKLAELLRMGQVHEVYYAENQNRAVFKQIVQHYDDVTNQEVRLKLKIKSRLRVQGVIVRGQAVFTKEGRLEILEEVSSSVAREAIGQLYELLDKTLEGQKKALRLMRRESHRYEEIKRFQELPGAGLISACQFSAYLQTPHRFSNKRKAFRYCRLGITDRSSDGKPLGRRQLDRNGNGRLKKMSRTVFAGAMRTRTDNVFKRSWRATLSRTHNETHARLSTQRKIIAVMLVMWKGGTRYQDDYKG